jgi:hypothetical protein
MVGGAGASWPAPIAVSDTNPQNIKQCLRTIKLDSEAMIDYINSHAAKTDAHITRMFKNIASWSAAALEMPGDASVDEVNTKIDRLLSRMENLHQDVSKNHQEIKHSTTSRPGPTIASWAAVAAKHLPDQPVPPSLTRVHSDTGTNNASLSYLNKDCEIIIKLGDSKKISTYRGKQPSEIRKIFNHQCQKAARDGAWRYRLSPRSSSNPAILPFVYGLQRKQTPPGSSKTNGFPVLDEEPMSTP